MVESISKPGRPGLISSNAASTCLGHLQGVAPGQFLDDEHQPRTVVDDGVTQEWLVILDHVGHVAEAKRLAVPLLDDHLRQIIRRDDRQHVADAESLVRGIDEPSGADHGPVRVLEEPGVERVGGNLASPGRVRRRWLSVAPGRPGPASSAAARPRWRRSPPRGRAAGSPGSSSRRSSTCPSSTARPTTGRSS